MKLSERISAAQSKLAVRSPGTGTGTARSHRHP